MDLARARKLLLIAFLLGTTLPLGASAQDRVERLLQQLSEASAPPGYEGPVRAIMINAMRPFVSGFTYDGLGSVIGSQGNVGPRIMLDAHMDEVGAVVRRVTPSGFISIQMLGGWLDQELADQRWVISTSRGPVYAISGIRDIHETPNSELLKLVARDQMFLDVGADSGTSAGALGISPGDPVSPYSPFTVLNGSRRYIGKAFDDRAGCAVLVEVLRRLASEPHPNQLFAAATVQEETGLRGAHTAAHLVHPDVGIAIEGGVTADLPNSQADESQSRLRGGPAIFLYNHFEQPNQRLVSLIRRVAKEENIRLQFDLVEKYGDDSAEMQSAGDGAPTICIAIPVRYMHAHNGVLDREDFDRTVELVVALIKRLDAGAVASLKDFSSG